MKLIALNPTMFFTDASGEHFIRTRANYGFEYFGNIILGCINGTDNSIPPETTLEAMRLVIEASEKTMK